MVTRFGMSDKFGMMGLATVESEYLEGRAALTCGEETAAQIDSEVLSIIQSSYDKAVELLTTHRPILDAIADTLYEKETITGKEFMEIFRRMTDAEQQPVEAVDETLLADSLFEEE